MDLRTSLILGAAIAGIAVPASAQPGAAAKHPAFHALIASVQGAYRDDSTNEAKGVSRRQGKTTLTGTEVQIAGAHKGFEIELGNRILAPKDTPWWSKRNELFLTTSYYWPRFQHVQPVLGLTQMSQSGNQLDDDAPPAFIDRNTAAILGLRSSVTIYSFGTHGFLGQGRVAYHTSFESKRNFGDESYLGLGYFFATGRFRGALVAGQMRNFFRAEKPDPAVEDSYLVVRHAYVANRIGLYVEY